MEVAGFAIGVVGLAGLYSTCIQLLGQIESSRMDYIAGDLHTLHARLCATNYLLKEWGRGVGLDSTGIPNSDIRHPKLADAEKRKVAFCILASVERLFENMEKLEKYGLVLKNVPILESSATVIEANAEIDKLTKNAAKKFSISRRIVWVVRDKDRFGQLLATLATLIGNLYEVIPPESAHALAVEGLTKKLAELCCSTDGMLKSTVTLPYGIFPRVVLTIL
ncbi:hypothetical protein M413DRAFT_164137 [Hebeloma cylindrosporum]|uniref:Prion-inhibition and propagation HeLo domain-containing protein n=1 Tax=Hebeloma cylindrosporum TaxID=76867 RepID=A0A0C3BVB6_HEBCY|nr:hypothetical protein M413DRAFT_164137 [Hebeloma cylindrosporum h7]